MPSKPQHTVLGDDELLLRYRQTKDNQWLGYLLERYTVLLLGVAMKYLKDRTAAEDAVQQVFYKALTHFPKEEILNFKGWLYIMMRNYCLQQLRDRPRQLTEESLKNIPAVNGQKEELEWKNYTFDQMNLALEELTEEQRKAIILFYLHKMSYQQIMEQTGFTYMQVKSFIQNGKRNLKQILTRKLGNRFS